jgi:hypothetical protein
LVRVSQVATAEEYNLGRQIASQKLTQKVT